jgi:flagellar operon protein
MNMVPIREGSIQEYRGNVSRDAERTEFAHALREAAGTLKFSAHAQSRMKSRNITLTPEAAAKLEQAVDGAKKKGAKDSLILLSDMAFIVNVPNRTVVTAMDGESVRENVFTNIDSTVVAG